MEVHPVADLFPMLGDEELQELAADIRERGLLQPIVLDTDGRILDGRNRYSACQLAGVEPQFVTYDGDDPSGYALAVNINRRHLTQGQKAMIAAKANFFLGKNWGASQEVASQAGVSGSRISKASAVLDYAPELADLVISGATPLNQAYDVAKFRKQDGEDAAKKAEREAAEVAGRMEKLRRAEPDLADMVVEGQLTLAGAEGEARERAEVRRKDRHSTTNLLMSGLRGLAQPVTAEHLTWTREHIDQALATEHSQPITPERLREASDFALALAITLEAGKE